MFVAIATGHIRKEPEAYRFLLYSARAENAFCDLPVSVLLTQRKKDVFKYEYEKRNSFPC